MDNFKVSELFIKNDSDDMFGRLYLPNGASSLRRVPMVIYAHGLGATSESGDAYGRELAKRGYAFYCFDFRGAVGGKSDGDPEQMSVITEKDDLLTIYNVIASLSFIDLNNVFLMGASQGGAVAALAATELSNVIKGLILLCPGFNIPDAVRSVCPDSQDLPSSCMLLGVCVGKEYLQAMVDFDFYEHIGAYRGPVLIIQGTVDTIVPPTYAMYAEKAYTHAQIELIDGAGHGFEGGAFKFATRTIVDFLDEEADLADESGLNGDLNFGGGSMGSMFS